MSAQVYIDGKEGTTGLLLHKELASRSDIEILSIDPALRKDPDAKREIFRQADVVVLCLPDAAAKEAVSLCNETRFLDASTAHRVNRDWAYGLPELVEGQREKIAGAQCVSNPGCYPTGFLLTMKPLIDEGLLPRSALVRTHAISGYSGGGKKLIGRYREQGRHQEEGRPYALTLQHKHVSEMQHYADLDQPPLFEPMVGGFYRGMLVQTPLFAKELEGYDGPESVLDAFRRKFEKEPFVKVCSSENQDLLDGGFLSPQDCNGTNHVELFAFGHDHQVTVTARLDNLGKGAALAAVQNLNLMLGLPEETGLEP